MRLDFPRTRPTRLEDVFDGKVPAADELRTRGRPASLGAAERARCCPAKPAVVAVMPVTDQRAQPVDLRLCAHHHRVSRAALVSAGAIVFGKTGLLVALG